MHPKAGAGSGRNDNSSFYNAKIWKISPAASYLGTTHRHLRGVQASKLWKPYFVITVDRKGIWRGPTGFYYHRPSGTTVAATPIFQAKMPKLKKSIRHMIYGAHLIAIIVLSSGIFWNTILDKKMAEISPKSMPIYGHTVQICSLVTPPWLRMNNFQKNFFPYIPSIYTIHLYIICNL